MTIPMLSLSRNIDNNVLIDRNGVCLVKMTYLIDHKHRKEFNVIMKDNYNKGFHDIAPMCGSLGCYYSSSSDCKLNTKTEPSCTEYNKFKSQEINVYKTMANNHSLYLAIKFKMIL